MFKDMTIPARRNTPPGEYPVHVLLLNVSMSYRQWPTGSSHALDEVLPLSRELRKRRAAEESVKGNRSWYMFSGMPSVEPERSVRIRRLHGLQKTVRWCCTSQCRTCCVRYHEVLGHVLRYRRAREVQKWSCILSVVWHSCVTTKKNHITRGEHGLHISKPCVQCLSTTVRIRVLVKVEAL